MQNFLTLGQPLLGEKYVAQKRKKKRRKIIPNIVDTLFRSNAQGQRMHSARTNYFTYWNLALFYIFNVYSTKVRCIKYIKRY